MKSKLKYILGAVIAAIIVTTIFSGCSSTPGPVVRYLFDINTNYTAQVVTNWNVENIITTNAAGFEFVEPVKKATIVSNAVGEVTVKPSAALQSWAGLAAVVGDSVAPGAGKGVLAALLGGAGLFAVNQRRKLTAARETVTDLSDEHQRATVIAENFAQSIETLREVIKSTPQLKPLDDKIVAMLQRNQATVGLVQEAATIVRNSVSNEAAKRAAQKILDALPTTAAAS